MTGPNGFFPSAVQEVYEDSSGLHLESGVEAMDEVVEYRSLTEFLHARPGAAAEPAMLAALLREAEWPAEAVWPELWSLSQQNVLSLDTIIAVVQALWGVQQDLARMAVMSNPDQVGVRLVATFPAVWPELARWATADSVSAQRIGRLVALAIDSFGAAGQVVAALASHPQGMALLLDKSGIRQHGRAVEILITAIKAARAADIGNALTMWLNVDTAAAEVIAKALASVSDSLRVATVLSVVAAGVAQPAACGLWLSMWHQAPEPAVRALLLAGRSVPAWPSQVFGSAVDAGVSGESLIREIVNFDAEALPTAGAVVLKLAQQPEKFAGMIGDPLESTPQVSMALITAINAQPAALVPVMTVLVAARREQTAASVLARVLPQQAAVVLASDRWQPRSLVRLLPALRALAPTVFTQVLSILTPASLAAVGRTLAQTGQWQRLAVFLSDIGPDAASLMFATIAGQDPAGAVALLDAITDQNAAASLFVDCLGRFPDHAQGVADVSAAGDPPARARLIKALQALSQASAAALFVKTLTNATGRAGNALVAMGTAGALLIEVHQVDAALSQSLLAHAMAVSRRSANDLCERLMGQGDQGTLVLVSAALNNTELAVLIVTALIKVDANGRLVRRFYDCDNNVLRREVRHGLAASPGIFSLVVDVLAGGGNSDLMQMFIADLSPALASDLLAGALTYDWRGILDAFAAANPGFLRAAVVEQLTTGSPQNCNILTTWLLRGRGQGMRELYFAIVTSQILSRGLLSLTAENVRDIFGHADSGRGALVGVLAIAADTEDVNKVARVVEYLVVDDVRDVLLALPVEAAKKILNKLRGQLYENDDFVVMLTIARPQLLAAVFEELTWQSASNVLIRLNQEVRESIPRNVINALVAGLKPQDRLQFIAALENNAMRDVLDHVVMPE